MADIKIALIGYGSMGKEVQKAAEHKNIEITEIFDINNTINTNGVYQFDIAIDFSLAESVKKNVEICGKLKKNIVIGTTGWSKEIEQVRHIVEHYNIGCVWASNFSIGMAMFMQLISLGSKMLNAADDFDIFMNEIHHTNKADSPSGTALTLAKIILTNYERKNQILSCSPVGRIDKEQLHVSSIRGGTIAGTHTVYIDSPADTIEITHRAKNRSGFAHGALEAAIWLNSKTGFFNFNEVMAEVFSIKS